MQLAQSARLFFLDFLPQTELTHLDKAARHDASDFFELKTSTVIDRFLTPYITGIYIAFSALRLDLYLIL